MLRSNVARRAPAIEDLRRVEIAPFDPGPAADQRPPPRRPVLADGGLLGRARRRRAFDEAVQRYGLELAEHERHEQERRTLWAARAAEHEQSASDARSAAAARARRIEAGVLDANPESVEEFATYAIGAGASGGRRAGTEGRVPA